MSRPYRTFASQVYDKSRWSAKCFNGRHAYLPGNSRCKGDGGDCKCPCHREDFA